MTDPEPDMGPTASTADRSAAAGGMSGGPPAVRGDGERSPVVGADPASLTFDDALAELQRTVAALETGGQPLEVSIALYERGVALHDRCSRLLADAELRVQRLVERAGGAVEARDVEADDPGGRS